MVNLFFCMAASLGLGAYSGVWGGKWCASAYDPPRVANATAKPDCPTFDSIALPAIVPVQLPPIVELRDGIIFAAGVQSADPVPLVIKVSGWKSAVRHVILMPR